MRRFTAMLSTSLLAAAILLGPGAAAASAAGNFSALAWVCYPHGTIAGGPSTTLSVASIDFATPSNSNIACYFRGTQRPISFGGPCSYENGAMTVDFRHRVLVNLPSSGGRLLCWDGVITLKTDLSITKTDGTGLVFAGGTTTYTIVVSNAGPSAVSGAAVADVLPVAITADTWTAVGAGGASGFSASGSGNIADSVTLPVGASVTYTLIATISSGAAGSLVNTATVTAPAGSTDLNPANNTATDTDIIETIT